MNTILNQTIPNIHPAEVEKPIMENSNNNPNQKHHRISKSLLDGSAGSSTKHNNDFHDMGKFILAEINVNWFSVHS